MPGNHFILMADIIGSRGRDQGKLMMDFKQVTKAVSKERRSSLLSPLTITLGDEFQGVAKDLYGSVRIIFAVEERIIRAKKDFKLKYVLFEGEIDTPINSKNSHEMMGSGLTQARELLTSLKISHAPRFRFELRDGKKTVALNLAFSIYQSFLDGWSVEKDYYIVSEFLDTDDYNVVAASLGKNKSLMWKRERSLKIRRYKEIKALIENIVEG